MIWNRPHPDGLDGCRAISIFSSSPLEIRDHLSWCSEALMDDVQSNCSGEDTTAAQKACGVNRLASVQSFMLREMIRPCAGITDNDDFGQCAQDTMASYEAHHWALQSIYNEILDNVHDDSEIKELSKATATCVEEAGYDAPDDGRPLTWQEIDPKRVEGVKPYRGATTEERIAAEKERLNTINQCAIDSGLYGAQETKWLSEIRRIFAEDPDRVQPLKLEGAVAVLERDGPAPFLTIRPVRAE